MTEARVRPTRRWWPRIRLTLLSIILVTMVGYVGLDWLAVRRLDAAMVTFEASYGPGIESRPSVPSADNRARVVRAAAALVVPPTGEVKATIGRAGLASSPASLIATLQPFVDDNAKALALAAEIKARHQSSWEVSDATPDGPGALPLLDARLLGDALYASALIELDKGHIDAAAGCLVDQLAVAASFREEPNLISQLIRIAVGSRPLDVLQRLLATSEPSRAALDEVSVWLAENSRTDGIRTALIGEAQYVNMNLARMEGGRAFRTGPELNMSLGPLSVLGRPFIRLARARYLTQMTRLIDMQAGVRPRPSYTIVPKPSWWSPIDRWISTFLPGLERSINVGDEFTTQLAAAELAVALKRYKLDRGQYPNDLNALVPAYLPTVPLDMFTGKPPIYALDGAGFTLRATRSETPSRLPLDHWVVSK